MGQLLEFEKQTKSTPNNNQSSTSTVLNIANPTSNIINSSYQTLYTISKAVSSTTTTTTTTTKTNEDKLLELNKPKARKPFIFNSNQTDQDLIKIVINPVYTRSQATLLSPCQALEKFNFNSPKVEKSVNELFESNESNTNETSCNNYQNVKFRYLNKINENQLNNESEQVSKYMPKSLTIDSITESESKINATSSFKLCLSRKITTNYKRCATEKLDIVDIEQENCIDIDETSAATSSVSTESKKTLSRPSSISINRQHLLPIKETNVNSSSIVSTSPYFPTSSSSSAYSFNNQIELQIDSNSKKMRLSPITDINPVISNSQLFLFTSNSSITNKSKSSENLIKTVNECEYNSYKSENFSLNNKKLPTDSKSFETIKSLLDDNNIKSQANSTKGSKNSLHGSIEKMIEVS